jgi:hypothetical protein
LASSSHANLGSIAEDTVITVGIDHTICAYFTRGPPVCEFDVARGGLGSLKKAGEGVAIQSSPTHALLNTTRGIGIGDN